MKPAYIKRDAKVRDGGRLDTWELRVISIRRTKADWQA